MSRQGPGISVEIETEQQQLNYTQSSLVARGLASRLRLKHIIFFIVRVTRCYVARGLASRLRLKQYDSAIVNELKLRRQGPGISVEIETTRAQQSTRAFIASPGAWHLG